MENIVNKCKHNEEMLWINKNYDADYIDESFSIDDIVDANELLLRFAPFLKNVFDDLKDSEGIIESKLSRADMYGLKNFYLKEDNTLPVAGSVKARGGIYEVLKFAENMAIENNLINSKKDYSQFSSESFKALFKTYTIEVGSTGNLGISIGLISSALGFKVNVHMSIDAKAWKKELLRKNGVNVIEYDSDYSEAVKMGRLNSMKNEKSYFVDDENSVNLFLGYATAAIRLKKQLEDKNITIDKEHPLFVYIPCGVGGAPGGILYGLKKFFKDAVHVFFVEPVNSACVLFGMVAGKSVDVGEYGIDAKTDADGLAVSKASELCLELSQKTLAGIFTVKEERLIPLLKELYDNTGKFVEPSASTSLIFSRFLDSKEFLEFVEAHNINAENIVHISWLTGGKLVPEKNRKRFLSF